MLFQASLQAQQRTKAGKEQDRSPKQELMYEDKNYLASIRSVQLHPLGDEGAFPIIELNTDDQLLLNFDDLRGDFRNFYFSIEYCNVDWQPSRLSPLEYAIGFNEDRIDNISPSQSTMQVYTHYSLSFPTEYVKPKIAGNYLLKIYEDADKQRLILTRKFYVYRNLILSDAKMHPSPTVANRTSHQKLNLIIKSSAISLDNPQRDVKIIAFQNGRNDYQLYSNTPLSIGPNSLRYDDAKTFDFKGHKEFRYVDLRSFRLASNQIHSITQDSLTSIILHTDVDQSTQPYASTNDEDGKFFILNMDFEDEPQNTADYANVTFTLKTNQQLKGKIYLVGAFNNFVASQDYELKWEGRTSLWQLTTKLKQGLYDYDYIFVDENENVITDQFSNSHFETGNTYQLLIYHRRVGTYWDELAGFSSISTSNKHY